MRRSKNYFLFCISLITFMACSVKADDGYRLWLKYDKITDATLLASYKSMISSVEVEGNSPTMKAIRDEIDMGLSGLLGEKITASNKPVNNASLIIGTPVNSPTIKSLGFDEVLKPLGKEGYLIRTLKYQGKTSVIVAANTEIGALYGTFGLLRLLQTGKSIGNLNISDSPKVKLRILDHWDNLNGKVERGYAGSSLWKWLTLPEYISPRYRDYARANASIGINGAVLNNVNANADILTTQYLKKVAALANVFRPYGIKVYLSARFSAPMEIGGLKTADPLNADVQKWWVNKVNEIYSYIPNFGGFLVKANSEGQPGPQNYGRTHADGANMLADALAPHGGVVMWRAFVYGNRKKPEDRAKQAYDEFKPLDGKFHKNVLIQVKNGPIDFQPREPFHPLFGAMPHTSLMMEFQITQEYLGQGIHLTYLAPLYTECLDADTWAKGKGSTVAKVIDGSLFDSPLSGMAGVSNIGSDRDWTGHPIAQSNWYAFGRLAWNPFLTAQSIANEWIKMTFTNSTPQTDATILKIMMQSREAGVNYREPLGLHHQMATGYHYGPGPWVTIRNHPLWSPTYYNKADSAGIGFDRTATGSDAVSQYFPHVAEHFANLDSCPDKYLLWFHHLPWTYKMRSGRTLWDELCIKYYEGVDTVRAMQKEWNSLDGKIDQETFNHVKALMSIQVHDATEWRNACVLYFQAFSKMPIPAGLKHPDKTLKYYESIRRKYNP